MNGRAIRLLGFVTLFLFAFCLFAVRLHSSDKKLKIIADKALIHLDPDRKSTVLATLNKGTIVSLGSERKFRKDWNYIYFTSESTGRIKSGYILDSLVEKLFVVTKKSVIQQEGVGAGGQNVSKTNFRNTRWGMGKAQVVRIEGSPDYRENSGGLDIIEYAQKIMNMDCMIGYVFAENKLAKAKYSFLANHEDSNQYILDYEKIRDILIQKYGKPEDERTLWQNTAYKNDRSRWGLALNQGHLEMNAFWEDSETEIQLRLYKERSRVSLVVLYSGLEYIDLASKVKAQSQLSIW